MENNEYLQWLSVPRNAWPCLDDVFAGLEKILALDDNLECRILGCQQGHLANDAVNQFTVRLNLQDMYVSDPYTKQKSFQTSLVPPPLMTGRVSTVTFELMFCKTVEVILRL